MSRKITYFLGIISLLTLLGASYLIGFVKYSESHLIVQIGWRSNYICADKTIVQRSLFAIYSPVLNTNESEEDRHFYSESDAIVLSLARDAFGPALDRAIERLHKNINYTD
jgi:hypothetical protein